MGPGKRHNEWALRQAQYSGHGTASHDRDDRTCELSQ